MTQTPVKLTFEDYLAHSDDDNRYEFVNGELVLMAPPTGEHADIVDFLQDALKAEIKRLKLPWAVRPGNVGVQTSSTKSRLPDLVVITEAQRLSLRNVSARNVSAVLITQPLLIVEVTSDSTRTVDYRAKRAEYAVLEVREYWIVDPAQDLVTVLGLVEGLYEETVFKGDEQIESQTFPDLVLTAKQVLAG